MNTAHCSEKKKKKKSLRVFYLETYYLSLTDMLKSQGSAS